MAEHEPVPEMVGTGGGAKPTGRSQCAKDLRVWPCEVERFRVEAARLRDRVAELNSLLEQLSLCLGDGSDRRVEQ